MDNDRTALEQNIIATLAENGCSEKQSMLILKETLKHIDDYNSNRAETRVIASEQRSDLANGAVAEILKRIENCLPENPYPESVFPMTEDEYVEAIPDPHKRTAISGFMGRYVFEATKRRFIESIKEEFED
ncbi:MAG: hypothetical protein FD143_2846 [Ignavibacteria bacterium]|nr:MAG: hypothetical protein FD143_2846 [Ignavibacteria bacterium]